MTTQLSNFHAAICFDKKGKGNQASAGRPFIHTQLMFC